jgi:hypothetical protein
VLSIPKNQRRKNSEEIFRQEKRHILRKILFHWRRMILGINLGKIPRIFLFQGIFPRKFLVQTELFARSDVTEYLQKKWFPTNTNVAINFFQDIYFKILFSTDKQLIFSSFIHKKNKTFFFLHDNV